MKGRIQMNENMRKVYEVEISNKIESIEDIDEAEFAIIGLLKDAGIPYETAIMSKMNYERFNEWNGRFDTYYVISIPEKYIEKLNALFLQQVLQKNFSWGTTGTHHKEMLLLFIKDYFYLL